MLRRSGKARSARLVGPWAGISTARNSPPDSVGPAAGLLEALRLFLIYPDLPTRGDSRHHRSEHLDLKSHKLYAIRKPSMRALEMVVRAPVRWPLAVSVASPIDTTRQRLAQATSRISWRRDPWPIVGFALLGSAATSWSTMLTGAMGHGRSIAQVDYLGKLPIYRTVI